jgi:hypothetical protein
MQMNQVGMTVTEAHPPTQLKPVPLKLWAKPDKGFTYDSMGMEQTL